jgi:hypothetical protein
MGNICEHLTLGSSQSREFPRKQASQHVAIKVNIASNLAEIPGPDRRRSVPKFSNIINNRKWPEP